MTEFGKYLAARREFRVKVDIQNPAADEMVDILQKHLKTVANWLNGWMNRAAMLDAMRYFRRSSPGQYEVTPGRLVYRGQTGEKFDGGPRSYSYDGAVADGFACSIFSSSGLVIRRKACNTCADKAAFRLSLDIAKVLKAYADHKYSGEKEVVILNTSPKGKTAELLGVQC